MCCLRLRRKSITSSKGQTLGALKTKAGANVVIVRCQQSFFETIECFCCHEKAVEYDEYGVLLDQTEALGEECLTIHPDFRDNILSEGVLKIDVCRYLEENWPLDDGDLEKIHKLYRLVAYQRCSRWIFQILGKKRRRPFPTCVYSRIRERFASPDGLYTHFKYAKTSKR